MSYDNSGRRADSRAGNGRPIELRVYVTHEVRICTASYGENEPSSRDNKQLAAMVLRLKHPDWPHRRIAEAIGVDRRQLYRWPTYIRLTKVCQQQKASLPHGFKNNGQLEAWRD